MAAAAVAGVGASLVVGQFMASRPATAATARSYTLRMGDKVTIPSINQVCTVSTEGGFPDLFCARPRHAQHQVVFFRDRILVWRTGNPDAPVWSGRP
jgi:hypothetical protein